MVYARKDAREMSKREANALAKEMLAAGWPAGAHWLAQGLAVVRGVTPQGRPVTVRNRRDWERLRSEAT